MPLGAVATTGVATLDLVSSRRTVRTAAFVIAAAFVGVACGGSDSGSEAVDTPVPATDAPTGAPTDASDTPVDASTGAPEILQFTSTLVGGGELDAAALADKPTAFWFWSPT